MKSPGPASACRRASRRLPAIARWAVAILLVAGTLRAEEAPKQATGAKPTDPQSAENFQRDKTKPAVATYPLKGTPLRNNGVDLSYAFPDAGSQGEANKTCVSWALGYGVMTFHHARELFLSPNDPNALISPHWLYGHAGTAGCRNEQFVLNVASIADRVGMATIAEYAIDPAQCPPVANVAVKRNARARGIATIRSLKEPKAIAGLKEILEEGQPILIGLYIDDAFRQAKGVPLYSKFDGNSFKENYHAVALVGYNKDAMLIQNSFGRDWGVNGRIWIPEKVFSEMIGEAWVLSMTISDKPKAQIIDAIVYTSGHGADAVLKVGLGGDLSHLRGRTVRAEVYFYYLREQRDSNGEILEVESILKVKPLDQYDTDEDRAARLYITSLREVTGNEERLGNLNITVPLRDLPGHLFDAEGVIATKLRAVVSLFIGETKIADYNRRKYCLPQSEKASDCTPL